MPLIYPPHDPRRADARLYKGGDGGAADMRKMEDERQAKVQAAVDAINQRFGYPSATAAAQAQERDMLASSDAPKRESFIIPGNPGGSSSGGEADIQIASTPDRFDEEGFNKAKEAWLAAQGRSGEPVDTVAVQNKTARDSMYTQISQAVRDQAMRDLDRQYTKASQRNTFGLARAGLLGGSVDAESGGDLSTLYGEGKIKAEQQGQGAGSDLRLQDEKTRQNLITLAQSGLDTGTASSLAAGQMAAAADSARSQAAGASVGRLFDDMSQAYVNNQLMRTRYPTGLPVAQTSPYGTSVFNPARRYYGQQG